MTKKEESVRNMVRVEEGGKETEGEGKSSSEVSGAGGGRSCRREKEGEGYVYGRTLINSEGSWDEEKRGRG